MKKVVSTFVMAALVGVAVCAQADERRHPPVTLTPISMAVTDAMLAERSRALAS